MPDTVNSWVIIFKQKKLSFMKKSKIFMAAGALVLAITAMFAVKANKKFTGGFATGYASSGLRVVCPGNYFSITKAESSWKTAIVTIVYGSNSVRDQLFYSSGATKKLYFAN
jgi:hypothetical protein